MHKCSAYTCGLYLQQTVQASQAAVSLHGAAAQCNEVMHKLGFNPLTSVSNSIVTACYGCTQITSMALCTTMFGSQQAQVLHAVEHQADVKA